MIRRKHQIFEVQEGNISCRKNESLEPVVPLLGAQRFGLGPQEERLLAKARSSEQLNEKMFLAVLTQAEA